MSILVSIEDLLSGEVVEGTRMEFKQGWNPKTIMRTVCAFANDFENEGSGYIIVGVEEVDGKPVRPVMGFNPNDFERVQRELIGFSKLIQPDYPPRISLEEIDGKHVLVIWVPAGSNRPYKVPDDVNAKVKNYNFRIRYLSSSIVPNDEQQIELLQLTAKIPFDDRVNTQASVNELSFSLMREHLEATKSKLYDESASMSVEELAEKMNLSQGANEHLFPKNVGLLMFSEEPKKYFSGVQIDLVEFPEGVAAKIFNEKIFEGPIQKQLMDVLSYIRTNVIKEKVIKHGNRATSDRVFNYPYNAIEEALSNAVFHRNYELQDPIEVRILPDVIEIISYNGADPSLKQRDFDSGIVRARRYRNRRIGEFLKELRLTEGRGTGIPTIVKGLADNGSPNPKFDANEPERTHFLVEIPIHSAFNGPSRDQVDKLLESLNIKELSDVEQLINEMKPSEWDQVRDQVRDQADQVNKHLSTILEYCSKPRSRKEVCEKIGLANKDSNFKRYAGEPLDFGWLEMTSTSTSRDQRYVTTEKGKKLIRS